MIHFFPAFSKNAARSPLGEELAILGIQHRLLAGEVNLRYRWRLWLVLVGWPKLAWFALKNAFRSMVLSRPTPDAVVVGSHIEAIIFGILRLLRVFGYPRIILLGFILTRRRSPLANRLRKTYFKLIFSFTDMVICYSTLEVERYRQLFIGCRATFRFIPFGLHINGKTAADSTTNRARHYLLSAGRSGRDYRTLFNAVEGLDIDVHLVCDSDAALTGLAVPSNVSLLRNCYGDQYGEELRGCAFVVIPLASDEISAGQMVLIQAMAFRKPTIVTRTPIVEEYVKDQVESLLVPRNDAPALRAAIVTLHSDRALRAHLGDNASRAFEERYNMKAYVRNLVDAVTS
jgi:glycosyltransferase involved in cell wall biosynthesis